MTTKVTATLNNSAGELDRAEFEIDNAEALTLDELADYVDHWPLRDGDFIRISIRD